MGKRNSKGENKRPKQKPKTRDENKTRKQKPKTKFENEIRKAEMRKNEEEREKRGPLRFSHFAFCFRASFSHFVLVFVFGFCFRSSFSLFLTCQCRNERGRRVRPPPGPVNSRPRKLGHSTPDIQLVVLLHPFTHRNREPCLVPIPD